MSEQVAEKIKQKAKSAEEIADSLDEFYKQLGVKRISQELKISHGDFVKKKNEKWIKISDVMHALDEWQKTVEKLFENRPNLDDCSIGQLEEWFVKAERELGLK